MMGLGREEGNERKLALARREEYNGGGFLIQASSSDRYWKGLGGRDQSLDVAETT